MNGKRIEIAGFGRTDADAAEILRVAPDAPAAAQLGALLGLAVGDALGTTYEFKHIEQPPYPSLATGPATDVVGGGPFELAPGQVTDDTQMAICIARSLAAPRATPRLDVGDLATRYVAWLQHAFDVGNQTAAALRAIESGTPAALAGLAVWRSNAHRPAGNGSLMRTAPIGVYYANAGANVVIENAIADSLITHADPRCMLAAALFDVSIMHAILARTTPHLAVGSVGCDMVVEAREAMPVAAGKLREVFGEDIQTHGEELAALETAEQDLRRDFEAAFSPEPGVHNDELGLHRTAGFVRVAFRLALWHCVHTASWRDAVIDTASRGGDADTNAAIVGALLGARDGIHAVPAAWIDRVLAATQPGPRAWADAHHPRHLLVLVQ
jgi:ADP-ribosylglycohydrolase